MKPEERAVILCLRHQPKYGFKEAGEKVIVQKMINAGFLRPKEPYRGGPFDQYEVTVKGWIAYQSAYSLLCFKFNA
jgi:hypothetical protein